MKVDFEHQKCNTTLRNVSYETAVKTFCSKCGKRFLEPEEFLKKIKGKKMNRDKRKREEEFSKVATPYIHECLAYETSPAVILESFKKLIDEEIKVMLKEAQA